MREMSAFKNGGLDGTRPPLGVLSIAERSTLRGMAFKSYLYAVGDPTGKGTREALNRGQLASSVRNLLWNSGSM